MAKTLEQYLTTYLKILDNSASDATVPPQFWVFSMWDHDDCVSDGTPERAAKLIEEVRQSDLGLYEVIQSQISVHVDNMCEQQRLQREGSNIMDIMLAGNHREVVSVEHARAEAKALLEKYAN